MRIHYRIVDGNKVQPGELIWQTYQWKSADIAWEFFNQFEKKTNYLGRNVKLKTVPHKYDLMRELKMFFGERLVA